MAQAETFSLPEMTSSEITALVKSGHYSSRSDVAKDAIRCLFEHKPQLKITAAVELYTSGEVSLGKAAEIAEMGTSDFKEALAERGIVREIKSSKERISKGLEAIKKSRR